MNLSDSNNYSLEAPHNGLGRASKGLERATKGLGCAAKALEISTMVLWSIIITIVKPIILFENTIYPFGSPLRRLSR